MDAKLKKAISQTARFADLWLPSKIAYDQTPGLSVGIFHKGRLLYARGFGYADLKQKRRATPQTLYHVASHSKMFTAVAIMQLVEQGKLRLDDKVAAHLPWFEARAGSKDAGYITVRQLLSHIAGVFRDGREPFWTTGKFPDDVSKAVAPDILSHENLNDFKYSNYGFAVLGSLVAKAAGMPYRDYVRQAILKPLGMKRTYPDYEDGLKGVAEGYGADLPGEKARKALGHPKARAYMSATGFVSNVEDLARFMSSFADRSKKRLIGRDSIREMTYPIADVGDGDRYGLGLDIAFVSGRKVIGHGGGYNGFVTRTLYVPSLDVGVVALSNSSPSAAGSIAFELLEAIQSFMEAGDTQPHLLRCEGIYRDEWGDSLIVACGKKLILASPRANFPLRSKAFLAPEGTKGVFTYKTEDKFSSYGEKATFSGLKRGKFQRISFPASYQKRIR